ncbi:MAG: efflux RND transporter periplasmic adaptor subunit [Hyphomicrobiales bacterium]
MKKIIITLSVLIILGAIGFTLSANKEAMNAAVVESQKTSKHIAVKVEESKYSIISKDIKGVGRLAPYTNLTINSETQGKIIKIVKEQGDKVRKGDLLAKVEDVVPNAQYIAAKAQYEKLAKDLERFEKLVKKEAITKSQLEEVRMGAAQAKSQMIIAKQNLDNTNIRSLVNGKINKDYVEYGSLISPGAKLYEIVNIDKLKLNTTCSEKEVLSLQIGQVVDIRTNVYSDVKFQGKIRSIAENADNYYRYPVEVIVNNNETKPLKGGMFAEVYFPSKDEKVLTINRKAIVNSVKDPVVYVVKDNKAARTPIKVGVVSDDIVEVISGINKGDQVIISGMINLHDGREVSIIK